MRQERLGKAGISLSHGIFGILVGRHGSCDIRMDCPDASINSCSDHWPFHFCGGHGWSSSIHRDVSFGCISPKCLQSCCFGNLEKFSRILFPAVRTQLGASNWLWLVNHHAGIVEPDIWPRGMRRSLGLWRKIRQRSRLAIHGETTGPRPPEIRPTWPNEGLTSENGKSPTAGQFGRGIFTSSGARLDLERGPVERPKRPEHPTGRDNSALAALRARMPPLGELTSEEETSPAGAQPGTGIYEGSPPPVDPGSGSVGIPRYTTGIEDGIQTGAGAGAQTTLRREPPVHELP
jgi:hypothetical protein